MKYFLLFFLLLTPQMVLAGTRDPEVPDEKYVEYAKDFHCIGKLCGLTSDKKMYCASAVAIKPRWIITAAHVVLNSKKCTLKINDKEITISKIVTHEKFNENKFGEYDIALGKCDSNIELKFYPELYNKEDEVDKICCMSGFGLHGTFNTGAKKSDNLKRAGSNFIDKIDRHLLICSPSISKKKTSLEFLIASGDSGGGLFIDNKLAGINSCVLSDQGSAPDSSYGDESGHTRISIFKEWIIENTRTEE